MNEKINFSLFIVITVLLLAFFQDSSSEITELEPVPDPVDIIKPGFVHIQNGTFALDGNEFRFAGTNAYYLPNYNKLDPSVVESTFNTFKAAGITVVRMWAFYDGYDCGYSSIDAGENVIQTWYLQ